MLDLLNGLSQGERAVLRTYSLGTYCIDLRSPATRESLVSKGLLMWVPGQQWSGTSTYGLTDMGWKVWHMLTLEELHLNAVANGCGEENDAMTDRELAEDLISKTSDYEHAPVKELTEMVALWRKDFKTRIRIEDTF